MDHGCCEPEAFFAGGNPAVRPGCCEANGSGAYEELFVLSEDGMNADADPSANEGLLPGRVGRRFSAWTAWIAASARAQPNGWWASSPACGRCKCASAPRRWWSSIAADLAPLTKTVDQVGYHATLLETTLENESEAQAREPRNRFRSGSATDARS